MGEVTAAVILVVALVAWHLRTRRHPAWSISSTGRFYIASGYPMTVLAVYWLAGPSIGSDWQWALGSAWGLAAVVSFRYGFDTLNDVIERQHSVSREMESLHSETASLSAVNP